MWKLNKSIAKELLPTQPVDFAIEPWWGVCLVNFTLDEFKVRCFQICKVLAQNHSASLFFPLWIQTVCFCIWNCICVCFKSELGLKKHQIDVFSIFWWFWCVTSKKKNHFNAFSSEKTLKTHTAPQYQTHTSYETIRCT